MAHVYRSSAEQTEILTKVAAYVAKNLDGFTKK
jgi:hypothetical protein